MERKHSSGIFSSETTRRRTLKIMAGSAAATLGLPVVMDAATQTVSHAAHAQTQDAPTGPYVLKHFNTERVQTIDALAEVIIPADDHSPGAKAAKVHEYIDEVVSSAPDTVKKLWADGLAAMDRMARDAYGQEYARSTGPQQTALMVKISRNEEHPSTLEEKFFGVLKAATIDGYYTSTIGIHDDLEYQGNTVVVEFPGCTHDEHKKD
jgi:Gluconate 2-dehydrogenase subunit 3